MESLIYNDLLRSQHFVKVSIVN